MVVSNTWNDHVSIVAKELGIPGEEVLRNPKYMEKVKDSYYSSKGSKRVVKTLQMKGGASVGDSKKWGKIPLLHALVMQSTKESQDRIAFLRGKRTIVGSGRIPPEVSGSQFADNLPSMTPKKYRMRKPTQQNAMFDFPGMMNVDNGSDSDEGILSMKSRKSPMKQPSPKKKKKPKRKRVAQRSQPVIVRPKQQKINNMTPTQHSSKDMFFMLLQMADARHDFQGNRAKKIANKWKDHKYRIQIMKLYGIDDRKWEGQLGELYHDKKVGLRGVICGLKAGGKKGNTKMDETSVFNATFFHDSFFMDETTSKNVHDFNFFTVEEPLKWWKKVPQDTSITQDQFYQQQINASGSDPLTKLLKSLKAAGVDQFLKDTKIAGTRKPGLFSEELLKKAGIREVTSINSLWDPKTGGVASFNASTNQKNANIRQTYMSDCTPTSFERDPRNVPKSLYHLFQLFSIPEGEKVSQENQYQIQFCGNPANSFKGNLLTSVVNLTEIIYHIQAHAKSGAKTALSYAIKQFDSSGSTKDDRNNVKFLTFLRDDILPVNKFEVNDLIRFLYDAKKTGDWGQAFWVKQNRNTMFVTNDRLAGLYSVFCGNVTIGGFVKLISTKIKPKMVYVFAPRRGSVTDESTIKIDVDGLAKFLLESFAIMNTNLNDGMYDMNDLDMDNMFSYTNMLDTAPMVGAGPEDEDDIPLSQQFQKPSAQVEADEEAEAETVEPAAPPEVSDAPAQAPMETRQSQSFTDAQFLIEFAQAFINSRRILDIERFEKLFFKYYTFHFILNVIPSYIQGETGLRIKQKFKNFMYQGIAEDRLDYLSELTSKIASEIYDRNDLW